MIRIPVAMKDIAERFVSGNLKLAEMKAEAKRTYEKIPVIPEGTPVAVISASLTPMVSPSPALVKEELGKEPEYGLIITPEKKVLKK